MGFFATAGSCEDLQAAVNTVQTNQATDEGNIASNTSAIVALITLEATTVYTTGSYADPAWITGIISALRGALVSGVV